jgi:glycosyltransferase involved in cell wall biosynthesis
LGHDTFRHYEAAACGAVPLISRSPILQYAPFKHGETAFFYAPEAGGLTATLRQALERRDALAAIGLAARAHAFAHHTLRARVNHMLEAASVGRA